LYYDKKLRRTTVNSEKGKFSYTEYVKLNTYTYNNKIYSLLLVKIKTGRTHQIRVHLFSIGHNIFCDKKYQKNKEILGKECELSNRLFLHAMFYKIEQDTFGYVKIPEDLSMTLDKMKIKKRYIETDNAFDLLYSNTLTNNLLNKLKK
jgi:23S rRNA-/tRNA-specific pseudouridylate synthase